MDRKIQAPDPSTQRRIYRRRPTFRLDDSQRPPRKCCQSDQQLCRSELRIVPVRCPLVPRILRNVPVAENFSIRPLLVSATRTFPLRSTAIPVGESNCPSASSLSALKRVSCTFRQGTELLEESQGMRSRVAETAECSRQGCSVRKTF